MEKRDYDAVVVGSGPNGLAAAITLQRQGLSVLLLEGKDRTGGGMRSAELTLPGFVHDICSAVHPMAAGSPFFNTLPLSDFGLEFIYPPVAAAHPFTDGTAAALVQPVEQTAGLLGDDKDTYTRLIGPLVNSWETVAGDALGPLRWPSHPVALAKFGWRGLSSALSLAKKFHTKEARGLWGGMAAHSTLPLSDAGTAAVGLVLMIMGHQRGWPVVKGGSGRLAEALTAYFVSLGGEVATNHYAASLEQIPSGHALLLDVTPKQLLQIAGHRLSSLYRWQIKRYRYGAGVFKIDWALDGAIPFTAAACREAGTVHLGNTLEEIADAEKIVAAGGHPGQPFVLLAQQSLFDPLRAPAGKQAAWAYCHVPNGSSVDMAGRIEKQVERFAPGFRDRILARHVMDTAQMEDYNPNYTGGDIGGGSMDIRQLFTRPALRRSPYRTSAKGIYLCSASTPPGGGVHGMCGYHAARRALRDIFRIKI